MFPTVPILKQYLKDLRRNSQGTGENYGDGASAAFVNGHELGALRAVIWCIKEFKLEAEYPREPLEKKVFQLERTKIDKRSAGRSYKTPQPEKRPRPNGRYCGSRGSCGGSSSRRQPPPVYGGRPVAYNGNRYPHSTPPDLYNYAQVTAQPSYAPPQPNDQRMYYYPPQDDRGGPVQCNTTTNKLQLFGWWNPAFTITTTLYVGRSLFTSSCKEMIFEQQGTKMVFRVPQDRFVHKEAEKKQQHSTAAAAAAAGQQQQHQQFCDYCPKNFSRPFEVVLLSDESSFLSHDLKLLESMEFSHRIKEIGKIIEEVNWQEEIQDIDPDMLTSKFVSDTIMYASSSVAMRDRSSHGARFVILNTDYSAIVLEKENSTIHIDAVLDPLSLTGQKLASLLCVLGKFVQPRLRIVLNPLSSLVDLPLKNYYRYVLPSMDDFSSTDYTVNGPKAFFANMPLSKTLTMNLDVPETWLVEPVLAIQYLKDSRRNSQGNGENYGDGASAAFVNGQELGALRAVIWCIKEIKLEAEYPLEPLEKRVFQLERSKIDKRSAGRSYKTPQPEKRPRPNGRYRGSRGSCGGSSSCRQPPPVYGGRPVAYNGNRYPHSTPPDLYNYAQVTAQPSYAPPQPNDQRMYYYPPQDDRGGPVQCNTTTNKLQLFWWWDPAFTITTTLYVGRSLFTSSCKEMIFEQQGTKMVFRVPEDRFVHKEAEKKVSDSY
ncbi:hypothetical protein ACFE04_022466 [Oxalis oulophora]